VDSNILYSTLLLALLFGCVVYASATPPRYRAIEIEKDLEKDVDDCPIAEKADKEEDPVGETSHVSDHGMLQKSAKNSITVFITVYNVRIQ
jgi:hypothetical protein